MAQVCRDIVVCDNGTGFVKCGFAGSNFPPVIFPSLVGRPLLRYEEKAIDGIVIKDVMVGNEAQKLRNMLDITYTLENGIVKNWPDMEHLYNYTFFDQLKIDPKESKILLTEAPMNPKANREKLVQMMFEKYKFKATYVSIQAILALFAQGLNTGLVVDSGDGVTHLIPVFEGFVVSDQIKRINLAGRDITRYLVQLLQRRGYAFNRTADFDTVRQIKEKLCYVGYDLAMEKRLALETTVLVEPYTLPDGRVIKVGAERFEAPEAIFNPSLAKDIDHSGLSDQIFQTVQALPIDHRMEFYQHIVLSGGTSMYPGMSSRLTKDITDLYLAKVLKGDPTNLSKFKLKIEDPPNRKHLVFLGGAYLAMVMKDRAEFWITREEYEEKGIKCLEKCFRG